MCSWEKGRGRKRSDDEHGSHDQAVALGDPAPLALRLEVVDEIRDDTRNECLEPLVVAVFLLIQLAVAMDDPPHVAGAMRSQRERLRVGARLARGVEGIADRVHRVHDAFPPRVAEWGEHADDGVVGFAFERRERLSAGGREREVRVSAVVAVPPRGDKPAPLERAQCTAQVPAVEVERRRDIARRGAGVVRELLEHTHFRQRELAPEVRRTERPDAACIEAVEAANGVSVLIDRPHGPFPWRR